jgi:7,8-dihydropterin-6-yl-methyl-4-(beta-D-ribofuranosyl)aminobenzene 5'-phosphate synthase
MNRGHFAGALVVIAIAAILCTVSAADGEEPRAKMSGPSLLILFDNNAAVTGVKYGWGFSCLVRSGGTSLLFDTGADGAILLSNMARLGVDPAEIDAVFLSHDHWDHVGGLRAVLEHKPDLDVHLTPAFSDALVRRARKAGARVIAHGPLDGGAGASGEIAPGLFTTGALEGPPEEHALVIELERGVVVVSGCSHPGIAAMLERIRSRFDKPVLLALGGYHLLHDSRSEIRSTIERFRALEVRRVAPIHCTGARARRMFKHAFGDDFLRVGAGSEVDLTAL